MAKVPNALDKVLGAIWDELKGPVMAGNHELASALFRGDAFVMYSHPETGQTNVQGQQHDNDQAPQHGLPDHTQQNEMER